MKSLVFAGFCVKRSLVTEKLKPKEIMSRRASFKEPHKKNHIKKIPEFDLFQIQLLRYREFFVRNFRKNLR